MVEQTHYYIFKSPDKHETWYKPEPHVFLIRQNSIQEVGKCTQYDNLPFSHQSATWKQHPPQDIFSHERTFLVFLSKSTKLWHHKNIIGQLQWWMADGWRSWSDINNDDPGKTPARRYQIPPTLDRNQLWWRDYALFVKRLERLSSFFAARGSSLCWILSVSVHKSGMNIKRKCRLLAPRE